MNVLYPEHSKGERGIHGYSQEQIAEKIGISRQAYAKWETGATVPDIEKCRCLRWYTVSPSTALSIVNVTIDGKNQES